MGTDGTCLSHQQQSIIIIYIYIYSIKTDKKIYRFIVVNSASDVGRERERKGEKQHGSPTRDGGEKEEEDKERKIKRWTVIDVN